MSGRLSTSWLRTPFGRVLLVAAVVLGALVVTFAGIAVARAGEALPGVTVEGHAVGGLSESEIREVVVRLVEQRQNATIEVTAADETFAFTPGAEGYRIDVDATVEEALRAGRESVLAAPVSHVSATFGRMFPVTFEGTTEAEVVREFVDRVKERVDREPFAGRVTIDPETLEVTPELPHDGRDVDADAASEQLRAVIGQPDPPDITFPVAVEPTPTDDADVEDLRGRVEIALAEPLTVSSPNAVTTTLPPATLAGLIDSRVDDERLAIAVDADLLAEALGDDLPSMETEPRDAGFEVVDGLRTFDDQGNATWSQTPATLDVIPSEPGTRYNPEESALRVAAALDAGQREVEAKFDVREADLTTAEAEDLGITHLIGTFTTYHDCCQSRVVNIQRLADLVRGHVLRPGEDFSVNRDIGERTAAKGFVPAGAIFQGEIRDEFGGGVSQFATTMYNAAFFAGIEIVEHRAHSLYISRYPLGREATLNYDSIDLHIRNDTDHGLYIHTSYTPRSITVSLFGNNGGREVTAVMGSPYNYRGFDTRRRSNPALPQGVERVVQSGTEGYDVTVERVIREGGSTRTEEILTRYHPKPTVIEVGTGPPPPPPPDPEPPPPSDDDSPPPDDDADPEPTPDDDPDPDPTPDE